MVPMGKYDYKSRLLQKDCAVTVHTKNLQILMIEMYTTRNDLNPSFMQEIFCENTICYNLCTNNEFVQPRVRSVNNGTESVRFKGPQLWQTLPPTIRNSESLCQFKTKITIWYRKLSLQSMPHFLFGIRAFYDKYFYHIFIPNLGYL